MPQRPHGADDLTHRVTGAGGPEVQRRGKQLLGLLRRQPKIKHRDRVVVPVVAILADPVFLHAEADVFPLHGEVGLDDPMLAVGPPTLKHKRVRPAAPRLVVVEVPLRPADELVGQLGAANEADPPRLGVFFEKLHVGHSVHNDGVGHRGQSCPKPPPG